MVTEGLSSFIVVDSSNDLSCSRFVALAIAAAMPGREMSHASETAACDVRYCFATLSRASRRCTG